MPNDYWDLIVTGDPGGNPGPAHPRTRIPDKGEKVTFCLLDDHITWVRTHYISGRTQPCLGQQCACQTSTRPLRARWTGYAMATDIATRKLCVAVLTEHARDTCPVLGDRAQNLRGARLTVTRRGDKKNAPITAEIEVGKWPKVGESPVALRAVLVRTWWGEKGGPVTEVDKASNQQITYQDEEGDQP